MLGNYHPMIIHFPIALLAILPLFILASLVTPWRKFCLTSTLILLVLGTAGLFAAVASGESAAEMITKTTLSSDTLKDLNEHYEHGEQCRLLYAILVVILAAFLWAEKKLPVTLVKITPIALLVISCGLTALLLETSHYGGKLVHEHHIHSQLFDR